MADSRRSRRGATIAGVLGVGAFLGATALAAPASAIIGGDDATEGYEFMAALYDDSGEHLCGGALVDDQWVLTAGHCTDPEQLTVRVGSTDLNEGGSERGVVDVVLHPEYEVEDVSADPDYPLSQYLLRNDVALLKLDSPVEETPVAVGAESAAPGSAVRGLGWGMLDEFGEEGKPDTLQQLDTEVVSPDRCAEMDPGSDLCSEHPTDEAQMCISDSGGPLVRGEEGNWELVGVVSRDGDFDENPLCVGPMVLTDPVAHADWIATTVSTVSEDAEWPEYKQGEMGWNIEVAKRLLADEGSFEPGEVLDDRFDEATVEALLDYQQATDLKVTGILDSRSWEFLAEEAGSVVLGDESHAVGAVQTALAEKLGHDLSGDGYRTHSPEPGVFGEATHEAVVDFQEQAGLHADGEVGPTTLQALVSAPEQG
ncbi:trypsin-like serine protease [Nocardiopsis prasina]|uniref:trypsin-like serine protease n=1 Tax=Nocardiopsis prasina TaxID=2015 RepID=UPI000345C350|nr:trypsin-like serine protease [Nocardiopsis prasina]